MSFELSKTKDVAAREDEGTVVHLADENGEKMYTENVPDTITVAGTYSARYRRAQDANRDRLFKRRSAQLDGETVQRQGLEIIAACVLAWTGFGMEPTKANVVAVLESAPWIREQVEAAMNDHQLFSKAS